jgi:hypothetical protein
MVTRVRDIVDGCNTNADGDAVFRFVLESLKSGMDVVLDFSEVTNVTTSFVNSSFVRLAEELSFDALKRHVRLIATNRQVANLIQERVRKVAA